MKIGRIDLLAIAVVGLALATTGCGPKKVTDLQRKEAELMVSEAQFAMSLRDWARAEGLLTKAVQIAPDEGVYWTSLGSMRVRTGNRAGAKQAYEAALKAYQADAAADAAKTDVEPWLKQVYVLALLGRMDQGRALLEQIAKKFPDSRNVRAFVDGRQFDRMIADPLFKDAAL